MQYAIPRWYANLVRKRIANATIPVRMKRVAMPQNAIGESVNLTEFEMKLMVILSLLWGYHAVMTSVPMQITPIMANR